MPGRPGSGAGRSSALGASGEPNAELADEPAEVDGAAALALRRPKASLTLGVLEFLGDLEPRQFMDHQGMHRNLLVVDAPTRAMDGGSTFAPVAPSGAEGRR
jgi:hypothetical protein